MAVSLRDRYGSAKEVAGSTAVNKASLANRMAKQAAAMSNNSKMTQALLGAQAANDAVSQGFDEGLDKGANMAAQVASEEAREKERDQQQKQFEAQQKQSKEEAEKNRQANAIENQLNRDFQKKQNKENRIWDMATSIGGSFLKGLF